MAFFFINDRSSLSILDDIAAALVARESRVGWPREERRVGGDVRRGTRERGSDERADRCPFSNPLSESHGKVDESVRVGRFYVTNRTEKVAEGSRKSFLDSSSRSEAVA